MLVDHLHRNHRHPHHHHHLDVDKYGRKKIAWGDNGNKYDQNNIGTLI